MSNDYRLSSKQLQDYLPGLAPEQDDLTAMGYTKVYRGIHTGWPYRLNSSSDIDFNDIGHHWTTEKYVAQSFATKFGSPTKNNFGYVVEGYVHPNDVADLQNNGKDKLIYGGKGIYTHDHSEQEKTVRHGAPIRLTGMSKIRDVTNNEYGETEYEEKPVVNFTPRTATASTLRMNR
jgi:hypothetical protein